MNAVRRITVRSHRPEEIPSYLYSHSIIVGQAVDPDNSRNTIVLVDVVADSAKSAEWLANYQADRLASGLHGAVVEPA